MNKLYEYVTAIVDPETGLFHGALFVNKPTPSGSDRFRLSLSSKDGRATVGEAIADLQGFAPHAPRCSPTMLEVPLQLLPSIGSRVVLITPKDKSIACIVETMEPEDSSWSDSELTKQHVAALSARGFIEQDTSSGDDPELAHIYDTYVVVRSMQSILEAA